MQQKIVLKLSPADAADDAIIISKIANAAAVKVAFISGYSILKKSIDARGKNIYINLTVIVFINEPDLIVAKKTFFFKGSMIQRVREQDQKINMKKQHRMDAL